MQVVEQFGPIGAEALGRAVQVQAVTRLVLHLGGEDGLATQRWGPRDPFTLGLHPDDLAVGVLGDLADQRLSVVVGHPVIGFDAVVALDEGVETGLIRTHVELPSVRSATIVNTS